MDFMNMPIEPKSIKPRGPEEILKKLFAIRINGESPVEALANEADHIRSIAEIYKPEKFRAMMADEYWDPDPAPRFDRLNQTLTKMQQAVEAGKPLNTETVDAADRQVLADASATLQLMQIHERDFLNQPHAHRLPTLPEEFVEVRDRALREALGKSEDEMMGERIAGRRQSLAEVDKYTAAMKLADELCASLGVRPSRGGGTGLPGQ